MMTEIDQSDQNQLHCKYFAYRNYRSCLCSKSSLRSSVFLNKLYHRFHLEKFRIFELTFTKNYRELLVKTWVEIWLFYKYRQSFQIFTDFICSFQEFICKFYRKLTQDSIFWTNSNLSIVYVIIFCRICGKCINRFEKLKT